MTKYIYINSRTGFLVMLKKVGFLNKTVYKLKQLEYSFTLWVAELNITGNLIKYLWFKLFETKLVQNCKIFI